MPSANGFKLEYVMTDGQGVRHTSELVAHWPAPFFVLVGEPGCTPMLYHAETRADADRVAQYGGAVLGPDFVPVDPRDAGRVNV